MGLVRDSQGRGIDEYNPLSTKLNDSTMVLPVDIQARLSQTIQTHSGVTVAPSTYSTGVGTWIDTDGFSELNATMLSSANHANSLNVEWSHDGSALFVTSWGANKTSMDNEVTLPTKARYARVKVFNGDSVPRTISAYAYLKA